MPTVPVAPPARMTIGNMDTGESKTAQYNPKQVEVALASVWMKASIPGQTYQEQQYGNTGNPTVSFDLIFDGLGHSAPVLPDIEAFLFSLQYPPLSPSGVATGAPPKVLFSWPSWIMLVTMMPKLTQTTTRWAASGAPTYQAYKVELEQRLTRRLGSEEVRRSAFKRSS